MSCIERVWDNGDMTSCGAPVVPGKRRCAKHWKPRTKTTDRRRLDAEDMRRLRRCFNPTIQPIEKQNAKLYRFAAVLAERLGIAEFEGP